MNAGPLFYVAAFGLLLIAVRVAFGPLPGYCDGPVNQAAAEAMIEAFER